MKHNKRKLRPEIKQAILADATVMAELADANVKIKKTIENWIAKDAIQLTAEANVEIICNRFNLEKDSVFALEILINDEDGN